MILMRLLMALSSRERSDAILAALSARDWCGGTAFACSDAQALSALKQARYDLLLLDECLCGGSGRQMLRRLKEEVLACPPRVLMLTEPELGARPRADCIVPMSADADAIASLLLTLCEKPVPLLAEQTKRLREQMIAQVLEALGLPPKMKGYAYLAWMLEVLIPSPMLEDRITTRLYPLCSAHFCVSAPSVERCVRLAVEHCFSHGDWSALLRYFGSTVDPEKGKPTNRAFLVELAERLRLRIDGHSLEPSRSPNSSEMHQSPAAPTIV